MGGEQKQIQKQNIPISVANTSNCMVGSDTRTGSLTLAVAKGEKNGHGARKATVSCLQRWFKQADTMVKVGPMCRKLIHLLQTG